MKNILTLSVVLLTAGMVSAGVSWEWYDGTSIDLEYSVGSGPSASLLIIDFGGGNHYQFEYQYDESSSPSGMDMITALAGYTGGQALAYTSESFSWGEAIHSFSYDGNSLGGPSDWNWVYYLSDNDTNYFSATSGVGVSDRVLENGSWDGWSYHAGGWGTGVPPVPEPATLALLAIGGMSLVARKRKQITR